MQRAATKPGMTAQPKPSRHSDDSVNGSTTPSAASTFWQFSLVPSLPANVIVAAAQVAPMPEHVASQLAFSAPRYQQKPPTAVPPLAHGVGVTVGVSAGGSVAVAVAVDAGAVDVNVAVAVAAAVVGVAVARFGLPATAVAAAGGRQTTWPAGLLTGTVPGRHCP